MLEDIFYELLPVVGFAVVASSVIVCLVMRSAKGAFRFVLFFACADIFLGMTLIMFGFHGVMTTIYGSTGDTVKPLDCVLSKAVHLPMEVLSDAVHSILLVWFGSDRLLQMLLPVQYHKISQIYTNWPSFFVVIFCSGAAVIPSLYFPIQSRDNSSALVSPLCRFEQVFGEDYFSNHIQLVQWAPLIGMSLLALSVLVYGLRSLKQRWTYNWSENAEDTIQLSTACAIRCLMAALAIHLPLLVISSYPSDSELTLLADVFIRVSFSLCLPIFQPVYYILAMPLFTLNVRMLFNKYSHNTKRTWQSATDPPKTDEHSEPRSGHLDPHGDRNPFGSWYSSTGNVIGEAGMPIEERAGIERLVGCRRK